MKSQEFEQLKDMIQGLALSARQSGTPSKVLLEMQSKIEEVSQKQDRHIKLHEVNDKKWDVALQRIEPYIKAAEDDREFRAALEQKGKKAGMWAGLWLTFAAVVGSIYYGLKHIK